MKRRCAATGKVQYKRHQEAERELARANKGAAGCAQAPQTAYRCSECRKWHLTGLAGDQGRALAAAHRRYAGRKRASAALRTRSVPAGQGAPE